MFRKPFNVKKNTNLRNSDTRKLFNRLSEEVGPEAVELDKKAQVAQVKIVNFQNDAMNIYLFDKTPMLFDFSENGVVYPTVFFLWNYPTAYPTLFVHEPVLQYLENGADLMLPGVIRSESLPFPELRKGGPVVISLYSKDKIIGPIAVGCTMMSTQDMIKTGFQGKGVQIIHVFRDSLWEFGPRGQPPTRTLEELLSFSNKASPEEALEELTISDTTESEVQPSGSADEQKVAEKQAEADEDDVTEPMESLLQRCFLAGLKFRLKKSGQLPIDVGQFYTQCVLSCVPDGKRLDMKKTKYKKFGVFIEEINSHEDGPVVKLSKKGKGADMLAEVNWAHSLIRSFEVSDERTTEEAPKSAAKFDAPVIHEYAAVTEPVLPLLKSQHNAISKGDLLTTPQVRELLTQYVKSNELNAGKSVRMDPLLAQITKIKSETADWNTLMQIVQSKMTKSWVIRWADGREFVRKIQQPKLEFKIENRAGNKKVTLISNLSVFGIDIKTICHQIQTGVATSVTSHAEAVNCEGPQVVVQGNQITFIGQLLMETYGIDKKFIGGLELAPKRKR